MQGIAIRYAATSEAPAIAELVNSSRPLRGPSDLATPADVAALFEAGDFLVLEAPDHRLIGAIYLRLGDGVAEIDLLAVAGGEDIDRSAVSQRLLDVAEMLCAARGCSAVERRFDEPAWA